MRATASFSGSSSASANSWPWTLIASSQRPVTRARRRISSCVVGVARLDGEAAQRLVERRRRIAHALLAHLGAQAQELDALLGLGARARHLRVDVEQALPVAGPLGQPLEVVQELVAGRVGRQRVDQRLEGARRIVQLLLADERDLERRRQLLERLAGPLARPFVDLDQLVEEAVPLGGLVDHLQVLGRRGSRGRRAGTTRSRARGSSSVVLVEVGDLAAAACAAPPGSCVCSSSFSSA